MQSNRATDLLIEQLISVTCGDHATERERVALRESLRGLVRLAKAEHMLEIRQDSRRVVAGSDKRDSIPK
jgi:hypothetical protein